MFAHLSLLVMLLTASLGAASPSSTPGSAGGELRTTAPVRSASLNKRMPRTPLVNKRTNSTRVVRSLPLLPTLGPILPLAANLKVDICLDLSVKLLGIASVNLFATANLAASISSRGISVDELAIVQAYLASELLDVARVSTTAWACEQACTSNGQHSTKGARSVCSGQSFDRASHTCTLVPKQLTTRSGVLAKLIAQLSLPGRSAPRYCQLCPTRCGPASSTPSAYARFARRQSSSVIGQCPTGLDGELLNHAILSLSSRLIFIRFIIACPISAFSSSQGFECVRTQDELEHCGGCSTTGEGVNCNRVVGIKNPGCSRGQCIAFECEEGFYLASNKTCVQS
ncbi:hypothetical protein VP01_466g3 [Puccinia sorghi]|uniref:Protein CPL1-like domain-containing protein n=1 Tax=Puccinia sorghi TaxID=27349 RepID=A0A0L6UQ45_9BASI|nr:hypothetical protein VP01_466g3 [Puccinia sorghi]